MGRLRLLRRRRAIAAFVVAQAAVTFGSYEKAFATNWVYVACYVATAAYAVWFRAWLGVAAALVVTVVRTLIATGHASGRLFEVVSAAFVVLFFLLVAADAERGDGEA